MFLTQNPLFRILVMQFKKMNYPLSVKTLVYKFVD